MQVLAQITLNFQQPNFVTVYAAQNDRLSRYINAALLDGATPWTIPTGALMTIRYRKPDGTSGWYDTLEDGSPAYTVEEDGSITFGLAEQALTVPGMVPVELNFYDSTGHKLSTLTFVVAVKPSAYSDEDIISSDYYNILTAKLQELAELADSAEGDYQEYLSALSGFVGAPRTAAVAADMLDTGLIYVYTGSETGWTYGDWYYYNGREWTSGGVYNSAAISLDDTLTNANKPAQAKAAGDLVLVQDIQPSAPVNKLWFPLADPDEEQVPTWDEFSELKSVVGNLVENNLSDWLFAEGKYFNSAFSLTDITGYNTYKIPCEYTDFVSVLWTGSSPFGSLGRDYWYTYEDENGLARGLAVSNYKIEESGSKIAFIAPAGAKAIYFTFKADALSGLSVVKNTTRKYADGLDVADNFAIPVNASTAVDARFYLRYLSSQNTIYTFDSSSYHTWWIHVKAGDTVKFEAAVEGMSYNAVFYNASNVITQITALSYTFDTDATLVIFEKATTTNNALIIPSGAKLSIEAKNVFGLAQTVRELMSDYDDEINSLDSRVDDIEAKMNGQDITYTLGDTSGYYRVINGAIEKASSSTFTCQIVNVTDAMLSVSYQINSVASISGNVIFCGFADANNAFISKGDVAVGKYDLEIPSNAKYIYLSFIGSAYNSDYVIRANSVVTEKDINALGISNPFDGLSGVAFGTSLTYRAQTTGGYLQYLPDMSGMTIDNQGVGSSVILGNGGELDMLAKIKSYAGYSGKSVCLLEGFINDWYGNKPLGTFTDSAETTVCGCVRSALNYIMGQNANLTVFLILDPYGRNYSGVDCSSTAENSSELTQYEYYEEIAKVAESLGIPVIKEYAGSQISENTPQYLLDNIHPNALGAKQSANYIWSKMKQHYPNAIS